MLWVALILAIAVFTVIIWEWLKFRERLRGEA